MSQDLSPYDDERLTASAKRINRYCPLKPNLGSGAVHGELLIAVLRKYSPTAQLRWLDDVG